MNRENDPDVQAYLRTVAGTSMAGGSCIVCGQPVTVLTGGGSWNRLPGEWNDTPEAHYYIHNECRELHPDVVPIGMRRALEYLERERAQRGGQGDRALEFICDEHHPWYFWRWRVTHSR